MQLMQRHNTEMWACQGPKKDRRRIWKDRSVGKSESVCHVLSERVREWQQMSINCKEVWYRRTKQQLSPTNP